MSTDVIANLLKLLAGGRDNALLRFSLGAEYLKSGEAREAAAHLRAAVAHDAGYSAAWKLLGRALETLGESDEAKSRRNLHVFLRCCCARHAT
jgi:Tfp pilus assembly protein PilF